MALSDMELEEQLMEVGNRMTSPPSSVDELLSLLDKTESFLSRVEQSPSESMQKALDPARKALVAREFLDHPNSDVKVGVASCISEITRITAPEAPYNDDLMKDFFRLIVGCFEKLDDLTSRSYSKRVTILETVAKVRSCVMMLDLECDSLILDMFNHFLKTIRQNHSENIFTSMETIMHLVLEESEDISTDMVLCLLRSVKNDAKDVLHISRRLAEKVISSSASKLKPYFIQYFDSMGLQFNEYAEVVACICGKTNGALEHHDVNASSECLADDSKLSERTVSDELPQGSTVLEPEVGCPEVGTSADKSPKSVRSNGSAQVGNGDSIIDVKFEDSDHKAQTADASDAIPAELKNSDHVPEKSDSISEKNTKKAGGQKRNSAKVGVVKDKEVATSCSTKHQIKDTNDGPSVEGEESAGSGSDTKDELREPALIDNTTAATPASNAIRSKKGRSVVGRGGRKRRGIKSLEQSASPPGENEDSRDGGNGTGSLSSKDIISKKDAGSLSDVDEKSPNDPRKMLTHESNNTSKENNPSGSRAEPVIPSNKQAREKVSEGRSSGRKINSRSKTRKERSTPKKEAGEELESKGIVSSPVSPTKEQHKDQSHSDDEAKSRSKRSRGVEEIVAGKEEKYKLDASLVGLRIKVWWPDDKKFYSGTVESFFEGKNVHKVVYDDGDVETLSLKEERWDVIKTEKGKRKGYETPDATITQHEKKSRSLPDSTPNNSKKGRPQRSSGGSSDAIDLSERRGNGSAKQRGRSKNGKNDDTPEASKQKSFSKNRGNSGKNSQTPKSSSRSKDDTYKKSEKLKDLLRTSRRSMKSKEDDAESGSKSKNKPQESGRKRKGSGTVDNDEKVKANGTSAKAKSKARASERAATASPDGETLTAKKRRRKG